MPFPGAIIMPQRESDEDEEIRDVEKVEQERERPRPRRRRYDEDDDYEENDVVATLIPYKNGLALAAYYCGVFGFVPPLGLVLGPVSLVLGIFGLRYSWRIPLAKGGIHAITGIILGIVDVFVSTGATLWYFMVR
jgi:hypothetical protein